MAKGKRPTFVFQLTFTYWEERRKEKLTLKQGHPWMWGMQEVKAYSEHEARRKLIVDMLEAGFQVYKIEKGELEV